MAVILFAAHKIIVNLIESSASEGSQYSFSDIGDAIKDVEKFEKEWDIHDDEVDDIVKELKSFLRLTAIYTIDAIVFLFMIPVEYYLIVKKEQVA